MLTNCFSLFFQETAAEATGMAAAVDVVGEPVEVALPTQGTSEANPATGAVDAEEGAVDAVAAAAAAALHLYETPMSILRRASGVVLPPTRPEEAVAVSNLPVPLAR